VYTTRSYGEKLTTECTKEETQRKTRGEIFVFSERLLFFSVVNLLPNSVSKKFINKDVYSGRSKPLLMSTTQAELQKEFELERMILFSDAVFAIAITLLIIEIKFPEVEKGASTHEILLAFKPTIIRFAGFILSFIFIGLMWTRHLRICKYLRSYNNGVLFCNLLLLFFIVCFPFTASGITEHINPHFFLPFFIYIFNIAAVAVSQYLLCNYIFNRKAHLSVHGFEKEKRYILLQSKYFALMLVTAFTLLLIASFVLSGTYVMYTLYLIPIMGGITRRRLRKYKPVSTGA
jgi:uncharacterized membrane protein